MDTLKKQLSVVSCQITQIKLLLKGRNTKPCREWGSNSRQTTVRQLKKWYPPNYKNPSL